MTEATEQRSMTVGRDYIGVGVGVVILNEVGEVLLLQRSQNVRNERGCWELPGGEVEFNESMSDAAVREAKEEADLDITIEEQLVTVDHILPKESQHWVSTLFIGRAEPGQAPRIVETEKCDALGWFALSALPNPLSTVTEHKLALYRKHTRTE